MTIRSIMPNNLIYRTFPLSTHNGYLPPISSRIEIPRSSNAKRSAPIESMGLGPPPAKIQKLVDETPWICKSSIKASRTGNNNGIQQTLKPIIEDIKPGFQRNDKKEPISMATADASSLAHIPPNPKAMEAIVRAVLRKPHTASYTNECGALEARHAIASHHSVPGQLPLSPENVIVTNGCSGALELSLGSLLDPGTALLVPKPGFPLYEEIAVSLGADVVEYNLDPDKNWECDLDHLEAIMSDTKHDIRAMVINNPSSHGAVFSEEHILKLLDFAKKHKLPMVSDEVYGDLTFGSCKFHPLATVAAKHGRKVPVITTSGLSKQWLVPGWRLGWAVFQDNVWGSIREVEAGAKKLAKLTHGISHLQQSAIPALLSTRTPSLTSWKEHLRTTLEHQAKVLTSWLEDECHGLSVRSPIQGSMYAIIKLDLDRFISTPCCNIKNDFDFCHQLVKEENVFCLPGSSFGVPGTIRVAFSAHESALEKACFRIAGFSRRHTRQEVARVPTEIVATLDQARDDGDICI